MSKPGGSLDVDKAIRGNRRYAAQELWTDRYAQICQVLGVKAAASEGDFARGVAAWQDSHRLLKSDGILGPRSWDLMDTETSFSTWPVALPDWLTQCVVAAKAESQSLRPPPPAAALLSGMCFPLDHIPTEDYHKGGKKFGAGRNYSEKLGGRRRHAGCDLIGIEGMPIYAVDDGIVRLAQTKNFYTNEKKKNRKPGERIFNVGSVEIVHPHFIARYCETKKLEPGIQRHTSVRKGQVIAYMGQMSRSAMLHFELYQNPKDQSRLTVRDIKGPTRLFQRRADLLDPTSMLDSWKSNLPKKT